jgi:hypothetical protein
MKSNLMSGERVLLLVMVVIGLVSGASFTLSDSSPSVTNYKVTDVEENRVVIEATLDKEFNEEYIRVEPYRNTESEILSVGDRTVEYSMTIDTDDDRRRQFITDESVFIKGYKITYVEEEQYAPVEISEDVKSEYSSINSSESELVMFTNQSSSQNDTRGNTKIKIVSPYSTDKDKIALDAAFTVSSKFEDEGDLIVIYLIPDEDTRWAGYAFGTGDDVQHIWVSADNVSKARDTVMHEVVHAHQEYDATDNIKWFYEGSAERIEGITHTKEYTEYNKTVPRSKNWFDESESRYESVEEIELSDPSTWEQDVEYVRGNKVAYLIDISLKHHTDGEYTLINLIDWMNQREHVTYHEFKMKILLHTDEEFVGRLDSYMGSREVIDVDDERQEIYSENTNSTSVPDKWSPDKGNTTRNSTEKNSTIYVP